MKKISTDMDISMFEQIKTVKEEAVKSEYYCNSFFDSQLKRLIDEPVKSSWLQANARCGCLLHAPSIQNYPIIGHYHIGDSHDIYVIAETGNSLYGFSIEPYVGCMYFENHDKKDYQKYLVENSTYVGKTVAEITKEFDIPCAEQVLSRYVPYPHLEIEQVTKGSMEYVIDCVMPKFKGIQKDTEEWWSLYDFCQGSILANAPSVLNLTIKGHSQDGNGTDYFVIQDYNDIPHYFVLHHGKNHDYIRYTYTCCEDLKQCANSTFIGKELREIVKTYDIPFLFELPEIFNRLDNTGNYLP